MDVQKPKSKFLRQFSLSVEFEIKMPSNVKRSRRRKNDKKIPQEFFLSFFLCLRAELILASPVTERMAHKLAYPHLQVL
jgi:hypothetical protein